MPAPHPKAKAIADRLLRRNGTWEAASHYDILTLFVGTEEIGSIRWDGDKYCVNDRTNGKAKKRTKDTEAAIEAAELYCYAQPASEKFAEAASTANFLLGQSKNNASWQRDRSVKTLYPALLAAIEAVVAAAPGDTEVAKEAAKFVSSHEEYVMTEALEAAQKAGNTVTLYVGSDGNVYNGGDNPVPLETLSEKVRQGLGFLRIVPDKTVTEFGYRLDETTFVIIK
jgi:hypothetical protein